MVAQDGLNVDIGFYPSAHRVTTKGARVPDGLDIMPLLALRYYAGIATDVRTEQAVTERNVIMNRLRCFEDAVLWEYALVLVRTVAAETHQNRRVLVWMGVVIKFLRLRCNLLPKEDQDNTYWRPLFNQVIMNLEMFLEVAVDRRVLETPHLAPVPIEWVCVADLAAPASM